MAKALEIDQKVEIYYTKFCYQYGFYEQSWYSAKVDRFTKKGNPVIGMFIFDKNTMECVNIIGHKEIPEHYRRRRIKNG